MKKMVVLVLTFVLACCFVATAVAEGKLTVIAKNLIEFAGDDTGYFYAKIENTGDEAIGIESCKLVAFSAEDDILISDSYITSTPSYVLLDPGEVVYASDFIWESVLTDADVVDYKFSVGSSKTGNEIVFIPCEARHEFINEYSNYVYVTFTNTTDEVKYDFYITAALFDIEGNLVYVDSSILSYMGIHPGSTITRQMSISSDLVKYYKAKGIEIASVEATVCYKK